MNKLSHIGNDNKPAMVDVTSKPDLYRIARASGFIHLEKNTLKLITENSMKKGNVLITAELAGVMGAKKTPELIPLCHSLNTTKVSVKATMKDNGVSVISEVICVGKTGVEMEALTGVSTALLTVYDMCKAVDKNMKITDIILLEKHKSTINE
ncbi:MAG TPA: cyclic pyranopterin monophosphate synthase MoaC [Victivallales bacterium]|nr:cyclic pyranopterin monophosphate synthase MoaC [Victivallales bacterium]